MLFSINHDSNSYYTKLYITFTLNLPFDNISSFIDIHINALDTKTTMKHQTYIFQNSLEFFLDIMVMLI